MRERRKRPQSKAKMTTGFPVFEANHAIFFMVLTTAVLVSNSLGSKDDCSVGDGNLALATMQDSENSGFIGRMMNLKAGMEASRRFLRHRHWYFKPRRKFETAFSTYRKRSKLSADNRVTKAVPGHSRRVTSNTKLAPRQISSTYQIRQAALRKVRRQKRSYNFDGFVFGPTSFPKGSMSMEDLSRARTKLSKIYHKATSSVLQIMPDGSILGAPVLGKYGVMVARSVDYVDNMTMTMMKIYGNATKLYIAMKSNGMLYTTVDPNHPDTNFLHEYDPNNHDAFLSHKHRRYLTMKGGNAHSEPAKAKKLSRAGRTPKRALFLNLPLDGRDFDKLASQAAKDTERATTLQGEKNSGEGEIGGTGTPAIQTETNNVPTIARTKSKNSKCKRRRGKPGKRCRRKRRKKGDRQKGRRRKGERRNSRRRTKVRTSRSLSARDAKYLQDFDLSKNAILSKIDGQISQVGKVT